MRNFFKSSGTGALLLLLIGCSNQSGNLGLGCVEKFDQQNQNIREVNLSGSPGSNAVGSYAKIDNATVTLNNGSKEKCIFSLYKRLRADSDPLKKVSDGYSLNSQTKCGEHIFRGWENSVNVLNERSYMNFRNVVDKNGNRFPLYFTSSKRISVCNDISPTLVKQVDLSTKNAKVLVHKKHSKNEPIFIPNRNYLLEWRETKYYRVPQRPNF